MSGWYMGSNFSLLPPRIMTPLVLNHPGNNSIIYMSTLFYITPYNLF